MYTLSQHVILYTLKGQRDKRKKRGREVTMDTVEKEGGKASIKLWTIMGNRVALKELMTSASYLSLFIQVK